MDAESDTIHASLIRSKERTALKRILACPAHQRSQQESLLVHRVLQRVEFVADLDSNVQEELANIVSYAHFEPFTTIFKEVRFSLPLPLAHSIRDKSETDFISSFLEPSPFKS